MNQRQEQGVYWRLLYMVQKYHSVMHLRDVGLDMQDSEVKQIYARFLWRDTHWGRKVPYLKSYTDTRTPWARQWQAWQWLIIATLQRDKHARARLEKHFKGIGRFREFRCIMARLQNENGYLYFL